MSNVKEDNIGTLEDYLNKNSLARQILKVEYAPSKEQIYYDLKNIPLNDVCCLDKTNEVSFSMREARDNYVHDNIFFAKSFLINHDYPLYRTPMDMLEKEKAYKDFCQKENEIFLELIKKVTKKTWQYYHFPTNGEGRGLIKFCGLKKVRYKNCHIFLHSEKPENIGTLTITGKPEYKIDTEYNVCVSYEKVAMILNGNNISCLEKRCFWNRK